MPTLVLADDQPLVRAGLRAMLELEPNLEVVGECGDGDAALALCRELSPDVLVFDYGMRGVELEALVPELRATQPTVRIVVLTGDLSANAYYRALTANADGFVVKSAEAADLLEALAHVTTGRPYMSRALARELSLPALTKRWGLTKREIEVFRGIGMGRSSAEIATTMSISVATVRKHRENLMRKLALHNVAELTAFGMKLGLFR
jgi:DNA-binding NarL/FixJ family response regulator